MVMTGEEYLKKKKKKEQKNQSNNRIMTGEEYLEKTRKEPEKISAKKTGNPFDNYKHYLSAADFGTGSAYVSTKQKGFLGMDTYGDTTYEFINNEDYRNSLYAQYKGNKHATEQGSHGYDQMTSEEIAVYNYIYAKEGKKKAEKYLSDMEMELTKRAYDKKAKELENTADKGFLPSAGLSAATVLTKPIGAVGSAIAGLEEVLLGKEYNPYATNRMLANANADARKFVGENIEEATEGAEIFGMNIPRFLYDTGMSAADSAAGAFTLGSGYMAAAGVDVATQRARELYEDGATKEEIARGAIAAGTFEALFEKLSLENLIKPKNAYTAKEIIKETLKQAGIEGSEEMATELSNTVFDSLSRGKDSDAYKTYQGYLDEGMSEAEARHKLAMNLSGQVLWAGIGGALAGGMTGGAATAAGFNNTMSKNEQTVVDAEVKSRITEQEKDGKKLTKKEKTAIEEEVFEELKKGAISIDSIESALGGETYKSYKSLSEEMEEYTKLNRMKAMELTGEQSDRLTELKEKNKNASYESEKARLKEQLSREVEDMTLNDAYIRESYNERGRRGQEFTADLNKYDEKQRATVQKAIDSKILNNTRRTHEFVDMIAKISADKGVSFNFTDNENLKNSGFALEGVSVNGYVQDGEITVNVNSAKSLNKVVGHEITHVLKDTEHYEALKEAVKAYAETKGEYQTRLDSLTKIYENVENANMEEELTADLVGDYLFSDEKFIKKLSVEHRNIFQKIYDEIKYLVKTATAGTKEAKQLLKAQRMFEKAYKENVKTLSKEERYSLYMDENIRQKAEQFKKEGYKKFERLKVIDITDRIAKEVKRLAGFDATGYEIYSNTDTFKHIERRHGENGIHDQSMKDMKDVAMMSYVLENYDSAEIVMKDGKEDITYAFSDNQGKPSKMIKFSKEIDGVQHVVLAVPENKYKKLWVVSEYIEQKKDTSQTSHGNNSLPPTPEAHPDAVSSTNSISQTKENTTGNPQFSLSGERAQTADTSQLAIAKEMEQKGENSENIRQETGWYRGYDGKWRFEIDDSQMKINPYGKYSRNPDIRRYQELMEKVYMFGTFTNEELVELRGLDTSLKGVDILPKSLGDLMEHASLFKAYPQLEEIAIKFVKLPEKTKGAYSPALNEIVIDRELKQDSAELKKTLIHEIQHAIQDIEGFENGSNMNQLEEKKNHVKRGIAELKRREFEQADKVVDFLDETGYFEKYEEDIDLYDETDRKKIEVALSETDKKKFLAEINLMDEIRKKSIKKAIELRKLEEMSTVDYYKNTAGEIEARNVSDRLLYTERQRREIAPVGRLENAERDNVVFSGEENPQFSLSSRKRDTTPTGSWNIRGEDIALHPQIDFEAIAPIAEDFAPVQETDTEDIDLPLPEGFEQEEQTAEEWEDSWKQYLSDDLSVGPFTTQETSEVTEKNVPIAKKKTQEEKIENIRRKIKQLYLDRSLVKEQWKKDIDKLETEFESLKSKHGYEGTQLLIQIEDAKSERNESIRLFDEKIEKHKKALSKAEEILISGTRKEHHANIMNNIKTKFQEKGFDFDEALVKAKDRYTITSVAKTPQRFMELTFGDEEGELLSDLTVNQTAQNETEKIRWLNSYTDRKNGLLSQLSGQYNIKPYSNEDAAAHMYGEGFYINEAGDKVTYGDAELAKDFPDPEVQRNIKALARDTRIRQIYDETLDKINESRKRNAYPEIPRRKDYFLHFTAMGDTFSKMGIPFRPSDIKAKNLPTDINGMTADLKPGQPYFASAQQRKGNRTTYSALGGLERYLTSAANQIYHIDDIQTLRAMRNYIAETFGQAHGLDGLDEMTEEQAAERIKEVYSGHLSVFNKFLTEQANHMAGKTALIDRGVEGFIGREGIEFLRTMNQQVGSNMVGWNVRSASTNAIPMVVGLTKLKKKSCILKAIGDTTRSRLESMTGKTYDDFAERNSITVRRKGAEKFARTPYEKVRDSGFILAGAVDDFTTEVLARAKYYELTKSGMESKKAHFEADKWTARILGDRSYGQQAQLFNSQLMGTIFKFQYEMGTTWDSIFYDTLREARLSNKEIQNGLERNAKTAAKVASTLAVIAIGNGIVGHVFLEIFGYDPTFNMAEILLTAIGWDDDEESEDTWKDNLNQAKDILIDDLPYVSTFTGGGKIPVTEALPFGELINGKDEYGNEKALYETLHDALQYYILPTGANQIRKTYQGLKMFDSDLPIAGSYTDSGKLRFSVEDNLANRAKAAVFGQYASKEARQYFDEGRLPLSEDKTQELVDIDLPISEYWEIQDKLKGKTKLSEKADVIADLDLPIAKKNLLINNATDRKEEIDLTDYDLYGDFEEFDFAQKNPGEHKVSKAVGGFQKYSIYKEALGKIKADKDKNGNSIAGSRKEKVIDYINNLQADYGEKIVLFKKQYPSDDRYNMDIVEYLNGRSDLSYGDIEEILNELGFTVTKDGTVKW